MSLEKCLLETFIVATKSSPSLRDVAQSASVSLGTASRALNNKDNVLPETRTRVLKAAMNLGYRQQVRLPSTDVSQLSTIGVIMKRDPGEIQELDVFYYTVFQGIENECQRLNINMMYSSLDVDQHSWALDWTPNLDLEVIDGLVIVGASLPDHVAGKLPNVPIVMVDAYAPACKVDSVLIDNRQGAYEAMCYLLERGHRDIGLVGSTGDPHEHPGVHIRGQMYHRALDDYGVEARYVAPIEGWALSVGPPYKAAYRLMQQSPHLTAIFAASDMIGVDVMKALNDLGYTVPDQVSVIGFDDTRFALDCKPNLTTMHVDKERLGAMAVQRLHDNTDQGKRVSVTTYVGTYLVERESVKVLDSRQVLSPDV